MEKRFIFILLLALILVWIINDWKHTRQAVFEQAYQYSLKGKSYPEIEENLTFEGEHYMRARSDQAQILSLINMMECRHYLLYENQSSLKKYYDFVKVVLHPELRYQLKNKKEYTDEIGKFLRRKRKLDIKYLRYRVARPVFTKDGKMERAEVYLIRTTKKEEEYLKYDFKKHTNGRYYLYLDSKTSLDQLKFKIKEPKKEGME